MIKKSVKKRVNRIVYRGEKIAKSILSEYMESFLYLLYISYAPMSVKLFGTCFPENIRPAAISMHLSRLYKQGYISKIKKKKNILISLVSDFWKAKGDCISLKRQAYQKGWDAKWRILIYDIPEREKSGRERLRHFIRQLGFGMVQRSSWISCYDYLAILGEFFNDEKISDYICIYEGKFYAGKNIDVLVEKVWNLQELFDSYHSFIDSCREAIEFIKTEEKGLFSYYKRYHTIYRQYAAILYKDPFLPDALLKRNIRKEAEKVFNDLTRLTAQELKAAM